MPKTKQQKIQIVQELNETLQGKVALLVNYQGLTVQETEGLRNELFEKNAQITIVKNTLLAIAAKDVGVESGQVPMDKPLAILSADDEIVLSKILAKFAKVHEKVEIIGGWVDGKYYDASYINKLSKLPGREELLSKLVGSINAPINGLANVLAGNIRGLVNVVKQYQLKVNK